MKTVALISGGKDSILSIILSLRYGHRPIVAANIAPTRGEGLECVHEIDSYSFQTVGHEVVEQIAACMELPLRRGYIRSGQVRVQELHYSEAKRDDDDEVEALYRLLRSVKEEFPEVEAVTSGAIMSNYQRHRVEDVCCRLGLRSLAFLWQRPAEEVLDIAAALRVKAILVKTATLGLTPQKHLGMFLDDARPDLQNAQRLYGVHAAGEGGEFETIVLDCPLFLDKRLEVVEMRSVIVDDNEYSSSGHVVLKVAQRDKTEEEKAVDKGILESLPSLTFPSDQMKHLPFVSELTFDGLRTPDDVSSVQVRMCESSPDFWACACSVYIVAAVADESMQERILEDVFRRANEDAFKAGEEIFFLLVLTPDIRLFDCFCRALTLAFPGACPPCCSFTETSSFSGFRLEVLKAPQCSAGRSAMVVRSTSCWCAPSMGPYSFSNVLTTAVGRRVVVSGCIGLVPTTLQLATAADMEGLGQIPISELWQSIGVPNDCFLRDFIAEFAFMYANGVNGLTYFGNQPSEITHITFLLTDMRFTSLLRLLWRWCSGERDGGTELVFYDQVDSGYSAEKVIVCRVLPTERLLCGASVEAVFEVRPPSCAL